MKILDVNIYIGTYGKVYIYIYNMCIYVNIYIHTVCVYTCICDYIYVQNVHVKMAWI